MPANTLIKSQKSVPGPFSWEDAITVVSNDIYEIKDLPLRDEDGIIKVTLSITILHAGQQTTGHSHNDDTEVYEFLEGNGVMLLGTEAKMVKAGHSQLVPKGKWHKLINIGANTDLVFRCTFFGEIRRPHLRK